MEEREVGEREEGEWELARELPPSKLSSPSSLEPVATSFVRSLPPNPSFPPPLEARTKKSRLRRNHRRHCQLPPPSWLTMDESGGNCLSLPLKSSAAAACVLSCCISHRGRCRCWKEELRLCVLATGSGSMTSGTTAEAPG
ncbi:uncharacterized protein [Arachis hypogaea]|uniref:uncharacterized protein n=1 Tax=Arachis hypogaea TaxID=3818 RepID=UPI003B222C0B|nr:uncharacterized protein DS421_13g422610 [Arachis hypogaea]